MKYTDDTKNTYSKLTSLKARITFSALICVIFILVYLLNRLFPLYSDDFLYSFIYNSEPLARIDSFRDIFQSQLNHYLQWGGRSVVHAIAQFLLWIGTEWADVLNSLVYVAYLGIIYCISNKGNRINPIVFLFIALVLWLALPVPTGTILWITGSANYLWGTLIVLLFLYPYYSYYILGESKNSLFRCILFFVAGIISGWTNENIFIAQVFFILCMFFYFRKVQQKIPTWVIIGFVGVCIGGAFMLLAPGNFIRAELVSESLGLVDKSLLDNVLYRVGKMLYRYLVYILPLVVVYLITLFLYLKKTNKNSINKKVLRGSLLFFVSAHVACLVMSASPIFPARAAFSIVTLIVIALGILYSNMNLNTKVYKGINIGVLSILSILFVVDYVFEYKNINTISTIFEQRETILNEQKEKGNRNIIFTNKITLPERYQYEDLSEDPNRSVNKVYADYYDLESVKVE